MRTIRQRLDALETVGGDDHVEEVRALLRRVQACAAASRAVSDLTEHLDQRGDVRVQDGDAEGQMLLADIAAALDEDESQELV